MDGIRLKHVSEYKYFGCVPDESGAYDAYCRKEVASGGKVSGAIRLIVNAKGLQLGCARILHEAMLVHVLFI